MDFVYQQVAQTSPTQNSPTSTPCAPCFSESLALSLGVPVMAAFCLTAVCWFWHGGGFLVGSGCQSYSNWHGGSHALSWRLASCSQSTYGLKSRRMPILWSGRCWTCSGCSAFAKGRSFEFSLYSHDLSGIVAGDSAICGRLAALILRLRPAGLRFEEFR